ncbi:MAG: ubiquitin-like domain-containing protein [Anaerolineales bacterium]|jgi:uncharacterized protein YabE (DUF348 family)
MKYARILVPVLIGIFIALGLLLLPGTKTVIILVEDQPISVDTSGSTVADALKEAGFALRVGDEVEPPLDARISDGDAIRYTQAIEVALRVDGGIKHLTTTDRTPEDWISALDVSMNDEDQLLVNGQVHRPGQPVAYQPAVSAEVRRAVPITLVQGGERRTFKSAAPTLGQALWEAGLTLRESDLLDPAPEIALTGPVTAQLVPGRKIQVEADGQTHNLTTSAQTVGAALAQVGLPLQGLDYSIPGSEQRLPQDGKITIIRVREEVIINQEPIPFNTLFEPVEDLELDQYEVLQLGQMGVQAQRLRIRYEDGEETSREVEDQWTLREPLPRIEGYGTKVVIRTEMTDDGPIEYWRKVEVYATSYSPCNLGVDYCSDTTASGLKVRKGLIAVTIEWYRSMQGHSVYVPNYGHAVVADVGGGVEGRHWIDLAYTDEEYIGWHFWVPLYFTTPVPPADQILYILP